MTTVEQPLGRSAFAFFQPFRVRYSEIDAQGVVFNAHYLTYFDTALTEYFRSLGYDLIADAMETGIDFHVVKSVVEYKAPILRDQEIEVCVRVSRIGNSSLSFEFGIFPKESDKLLATGEIVWVYTDQRSHKAVTIPASLRTLIATRDQHLMV